jgi:hypothetical protein
VDDKCARLDDGDPFERSLVFFGLIGLSASPIPSFPQGKGNDKEQCAIFSSAIFIFQGAIYWMAKWLSALNESVI